MIENGIWVLFTAMAVCVLAIFIAYKIITFDYIYKHKSLLESRWRIEVEKNKINDKVLYYLQVKFIGFWWYITWAGYLKLKFDSDTCRGFESKECAIDKIKEIKQKLREEHDRKSITNTIELTDDLEEIVLEREENKTNKE